jgi:hypothetical protein
VNLTQAVLVVPVKVKSKQKQVVLFYLLLNSTSQDRNESIECECSERPKNTLLNEHEYTPQDHQIDTLVSVVLVDII